MCTVAFVPRRGGYLIGHNRDELRERGRAEPPRLHDLGGMQVLAPRDPDGGGTWVGANAAGVTFCLLNAREARPERDLDDPLSRGRVLWEILAAPRVGEALDPVREPALTNVRAFELLGIDPDGDEPGVVRLRWDGHRLERSRHRGPSLFVSSSLAIVRDVVETRSALWQRLLQLHPRPGERELRGFLAGHEPERGPLSVCMHRPEARTVSRTLVSAALGDGGPGIEMAYTDGPPCAPDRPEERSRLQAR